MKLFQPSRSKYIYATYKKPNGKQDQFSCKTTNEKEAYRYALNEVARRLATTDKPKIKPQSLGEFEKDYLEYVSARFKPSAVKAIKSSFRLFIKRVGDKPLKKLTVEECDRFIYVDQPSDWTARKHYGHLKAAFKRAKKWKRILENPFDEIDKPSIPELVPEYLLVNEFQELYNALPSESFEHLQLKNLTLLAYETGMRLGELRHAESKSIDFVAGMIKVVNQPGFQTKSRKIRAIPLSNEALYALRNQLKLKFSHGNEEVRESRLLFCRDDGKPFPEKTVSFHFLQTRRRIFPEKAKLSFHDLRHSYGTVNALCGVPLQEIQKAMGHATIATTEKYAHLDRMEYPNLKRAINEKPPIAPPSGEGSEEPPLFVDSTDLNRKSK